MTFKHHDLKIWPEFYADLIAGRKPFELRKNDRDFEVGDELDLHEFDPKTEKFTGCVTLRTVTYILGHRPDVGCAATYGIQPGYVILGIASPAQGSWMPIETAPHAKRVLLGWRDWRDHQWCVEAGPATTGQRFGNGYSNLSQHGSATHWQAIPEGPELPSTERVGK